MQLGATNRELDGSTTEGGERRLRRSALLSRQRCRPGGVTHHQLGLDPDETGRRVLAGQPLRQKPSRGRAHLHQGLPDGGQRRVLKGSAKNIVKADDRHVLGYPQPVVEERPDSADRRDVIEGTERREARSAIPGQKLLPVGVAFLVSQTEIKQSWVPK